MRVNHMNEEKKMEHRFEIHGITYHSIRTSMISPRLLAETIQSQGLAGIAVTDFGRVTALPEVEDWMDTIGIREARLLAGMSVRRPKQVNGETKYFDRTFIAVSLEGRRNLYEYSCYGSEISWKYHQTEPIFDRELPVDMREGILIGSGWSGGELNWLLESGASEEMLKEAVLACDFLEIIPDKTYEEDDEETIENTEKIKRIIDLGERYGIPVIASSGYGIPKTTAELLADLSYLGEEKAYEVVVTNSRWILEQSEAYSMSPDSEFFRDWKDTDPYYEIPLAVLCFPDTGMSYLEELDYDKNCVLRFPAKKGYGREIPVTYTTAGKRGQRSIMQFAAEHLYGVKEMVESK